MFCRIVPSPAQVNFLWDKNDIRTAIQQFQSPQKIYPHLQKKFLDTLLILAVINTANWANGYEMLTVKITADHRDIKQNYR